MGKEYEIRVLDVDYAKMVKSLKRLKGKCPMGKVITRQGAFFTCVTDATKYDSYARVRDEGDKVTICTKVKTPESQYPEETEVTIASDFDTGMRLLLSLGIQFKSIQEKIRETWILPNKNIHEVTFDIIPGCPMYMELDCKDENTLNEVFDRLEIRQNYGTDQIQYGLHYGYVYEHYYGNEGKTFAPNLSFEGIMHDFVPVKNRDFLHKMYHQHLPLYAKIKGDGLDNASADRQKSKGIKGRKDIKGKRSSSRGRQRR